MIPIKSLKIFQSFVSEPRLQLSKRWPSKAAPHTGCVSNLGHSQVKSVSGKDTTLPQLFIKTFPLNAKGHVSAVVFCSLGTFFVCLFSKDQRFSDGYLPRDEEQAAKHFTEHVLVLSQQRHRVHPFQACSGR